MPTSHTHSNVKILCIGDDINVTFNKNYDLTMDDFNHIKSYVNKEENITKEPCIYVIKDITNKKFYVDDKSWVDDINAASHLSIDQIINFLKSTKEVKNYEIYAYYTFSHMRKSYSYSLQILPNNKAMCVESEYFIFKKFIEKYNKVDWNKIYSSSEVTVFLRIL